MSAYPELHIRIISQRSHISQYTRNAFKLIYNAEHFSLYIFKNNLFYSVKMVKFKSKGRLIKLNFRRLGTHALRGLHSQANILFISTGCYNFFLQLHTHIHKCIDIQKYINGAR